MKKKGGLTPLRRLEQELSPDVEEGSKDLLLVQEGSKDQLLGLRERSKDQLVVED